MSADGAITLIGRGECGCVVAAVVLSPGRDLTDTLAEWHEEEFRIEAVTLAEARELLGVVACRSDEHAEAVRATKEGDQS